MAKAWSIIRLAVWQTNWWRHWCYWCYWYHWSTGKTRHSITVVGYIQRSHKPRRDSIWRDMARWDAIRRYRMNNIAWHAVRSAGYIHRPYTDSIVQTGHGHRYWCCHAAMNRHWWKTRDSIRCRYRDRNAVRWSWYSSTIRWNCGNMDIVRLHWSRNRSAVRWDWC